MHLLLLAACGRAPDDTAAPAPDLRTELTEAGPWRAGYRASELSYPDPAGGGDRTLRLALWYPTEDETGDEVRYDGLFEAPGVLGDATPASGPWPLVVFSHGHQGFAENSGFLMAFLASHGFLLAAPDHTDNTFLDGSDRTTAIYFQRPLDLSAVLDHVLGGGEAGLVASDDPILLMGHSFGGYTAFSAAGAPYDVATLAAGCADGTGPSAFCSTWTEADEALFAAGFLDDRWSAILPMAPGDSDLFALDGLGQIGAPTLLMNGDLDGSTTTDGDAYWAALGRPEDRRVIIAGGTHQVFTDFSGVLDPVDGEIDADLGHEIIDAYALAWAWRTLGDETGAPLLDGELSISDAATLSGY